VQYTMTENALIVYRKAYLLEELESTKEAYYPGEDALG